MADLRSEDWCGERASRWVEMADAIEVQLAPVSDELFASAGLRSGERVLDVGCGTGPTTRRAAEQLVPDGVIVGIDVAPEMIEAAAARTSRDGGVAIDWVTADVATWHPDGAFDVVISRFGVMFFDDPEAAFTNLAGLTVDGGRLCVAVWAGRGASPCFEVPLAAAVQELASRGVDAAVPPDDGGPFSLGEPAAVTAMLERAGWRDAAWTPRTVRIALGGGRDPDGAAAISMQLGPLRIVTQDLDEATTDAARRAVAARLADHVDGDGHVVLDATIGIVTATR